MQKSIFIIFIIFFFTPVGTAQQLYIPRDVKKAYQQNPRSKDGKPGKNYWQNHGRYDIHISVHPPNRTIQGKETITYFNNSPDTLNQLIFKLFLNKHKPQAARMYPTSKDYLTSGIHIDKYTENGVVRKFTDINAINKWVELKKPLPPNDSIELSFEWHYKVSIQSGREGAIDSTTFFLAYFYPRVAVYDDYSGWDKMRTQGSLEFYNDFNNYTFSVKVPKNYIVWATGLLQNPNEVLQQKYVDLLKKSKRTDSIIKIAHQKELKMHAVTKQKEFNTWKWKAQNVTDIAIALSNHYNWDAGSVVVDSTTGRRASVQAAYDEKSKDFQKMVQYGKHALNWFSNYYPGVPYPYPKSTIIRGYADMEYPMMVNDNSTDKAFFTRFVVEHEIAHTYFPFYMGINETRFAFMDEGWATTLEYLIGIKDLGKKRATKFFQRFRVERWINNPSMVGDIPIITPSNVLRGAAYGNNAYGKAALGYLAVKDLLGDELFKKALHGYMKRWHGKHPIPWDFFYSFNDITKRNLNWFWSRWFFQPNYIDLGIQNVKQKKNTLQLTLINIGGMPAPVDILLTFKDGTQRTIHQSPIIWKNDAKKTVLTIKKEKETKKIELKGGIWMDANTSNNKWLKAK